MLERNPNAFDSKYKIPTDQRNSSIVTSSSSPLNQKVASSINQSTAAHKVGCKCRKSKCLKKYCECYEGAVPCSSICICVSCENPVNLDRFSSSYRKEASGDYHNIFLDDPIPSIVSSEDNVPIPVSRKRPPLAPNYNNCSSNSSNNYPVDNNNDNNFGSSAPLKLARKRLKEETTAEVSPATPSSISVASALSLLSSSLPQIGGHGGTGGGGSTLNKLQIANALAVLSQSILHNESSSPLVTSSLLSHTPNTLNIASALALLSSIDPTAANNPFKNMNTPSLPVQRHNKENEFPSS